MKGFNSLKCYVKRHQQLQQAIKILSTIGFKSKFQLSDAFNKWKNFDKIQEQRILQKLKNMENLNELENYYNQQLKKRQETVENQQLIIDQEEEKQQNQLIAKFWTYWTNEVDNQQKLERDAKFEEIAEDIQYYNEEYKGVKQENKQILIQNEYLQEQYDEGQRMSLALKHLMKEKDKYSFENSDQEDILQNLIYENNQLKKQILEQEKNLRNSRKFQFLDSNASYSQIQMSNTTHVSIHSQNFLQFENQSYNFYKDQQLQGYNNSINMDQKDSQIQENENDMLNLYVPQKNDLSDLVKDIKESNFQIAQ
ncbi:hypothetical protein PPERSA_03277 [Pseudocohnilembus persalinus]|uniref:Uncharacterized protein n=1 Tax=Pseudocohnilembus persalinus TaxID=266149 RepID=A0A0V0QYZ1_PSEPJ|nr:hypothetical protein PPERSA_03277 [Pseudocohnilembus persalinus]|eukprot:KRX07444.1 hypothetical protein PPERSA_03277 [Pseudocohnilembus persalinus]